jgi:membrane protease YdiL (CAAX protease family)
MRKRLPSEPRPIWTSGQAWVCSLVLIALAIAAHGWFWSIARFSPTAGRWLGSSAGQMCWGLLQIALWLVVAFWFARQRSLHAFLMDVGLRVKPTLSGWIGACSSLGIGFVANYGTQQHWIPQNHAYRAFYHSGPIWLAWIAQIVVLAPFCEETTIRGFLYRAFRTSYGQTLSTILVLCVELYFHWRLVSHSLCMFACWAVFQVLMCQLRERTASTWNCILPHVAYNATQCLPWQACVIGTILLFPYCTRSADDLSLGKKPLSESQTR